MSPSLSFEFFPPKTPALEEGLWRAAESLAPLRPAFISVTYGAGGSTRARTHEIVVKMQGQGLRAAAHLTCIGASKAEIHEIADAYWLAGIRHIVALRGDLPEGYTHPADGYHTAAQLVAGLKARHPFEVSVGGYPEMHPESVSAEADMARLKEKVDAGADRIITQFFFDNALFFAFVERARRAGITVPIVPGLLPIANFTKAASFAAKCKASIPPAFAARFASFDEKPEAERHNIAVEALHEQAAGLVAGGVEHLHFYTLNKAEIILDACHDLA